MAPWMRWQMFTPLGLLLCLNLFWTYLIFRVIKRCVAAALRCSAL
jgi:acyl-CoA-dependent ceramide synthase